MRKRSVESRDHTCVFCDIVAHRSPAETLDENDHAFAVLDARPIRHGHALIIPKVHCRDFLLVPPGLVGELMEATQRVASANVRALSLEGFNLFSNNGWVAGGTGFHFHLHVTPPHRDDRIRFELTLKRYAGGQMQEMGRRIRQYLPDHSRQTRGTSHADL